VPDFKIFVFAGLVRDVAPDRVRLSGF
jgi:hypothetical protein